MDPTVMYHLGRVQHEAIQETLKELHREPPIWQPLQAAIAAFVRRAFSRQPMRPVLTAQPVNTERC